MKTLKDLEKDYEWNYNTYNAIRQEAIKWIKEIRNAKIMSGLTQHARDTIQLEFIDGSSKKSYISRSINT